MSRAWRVGLVGCGGMGRHHTADTLFRIDQTPAYPLAGALAVVDEGHLQTEFGSRCQLFIHEGAEETVAIEADARPCGGHGGFPD